MSYVEKGSEVLGKILKNNDIPTEVKDILVKQQQDIFWLRKELLGLSQTIDQIVDNLYVLANANDAMLKNQKELMERSTTKSIQNDINNDSD
ncbi:MAG: hypothetical protein IKH36_01930 [Bacilli bacterium]|nr:hypothetical protein [Bacilli bacterium]